MANPKDKIDMVPLEDSRMLVDDFRIRHSVHNPELNKKKRFQYKEHQHDPEAFNWDVDHPTKSPTTSPKSGALKSRNLHTTFEHPLLSDIDKIMAEMEKKGTVNVKPKISRKKKIENAPNAQMRSTIESVVGSPKKMKKILLNLKNSTKEAWAKLQPCNEIPKVNIVKEESALLKVKVKSEKMARKVMNEKSWIRTAFEKFDNHKINSQQFAHEITSRGIPLTQDFYVALKAKNVKFSRMIQALVKGRPLSQRIYMPQDCKKPVSPTASSSIISHNQKSDKDLEDSHNIISNDPNFVPFQGVRSKIKAGVSDANADTATVPSVAAGLSTDERHPSHSARRHYSPEIKLPKESKRMERKKRLDQTSILTSDTTEKAPQNSLTNKKPILQIRKKVENMIRGFIQWKLSPEEFSHQIEETGLDLSDKQRAYIKNSALNPERKYREARMVFGTTLSPRTTMPKSSAPPPVRAGLASKIGDFNHFNITTGKGSTNVSNDSPLSKTISRKKKKAMPLGPASPGAQGRRRFSFNAELKSNFKIAESKQKPEPTVSEMRSGKRKYSRSTEYHRSNLSSSLELKNSSTENDKHTVSRPETSRAISQCTSAQMSSPKQEKTKISFSSKPKGVESSEISAPSSLSKRKSTTKLGKLDTRLRIDKPDVLSPMSVSNKPKLKSPFGISSDVISPRNVIKDSRLSRYEKLKQGGTLGRYSKDKAATIVDRKSL
eukprot:jgi/Bigna1/141349/aug1.62_g16057